MAMPKDLDCVVCGAAVIDILVRPVSLEQPIGAGRLFHVDPIETATGGNVSNAGIALARLGMRVAAFTALGADDWGTIFRGRLTDENIEVDRILIRDDLATSTTAVLIDPQGEHTFAHCGGAWAEMVKDDFLRALDLFARSRMALFGYYGLAPKLEADLPEVLAEVRARGCQTALDAAGDGGELHPLDTILPHLDVYVPSHAEAAAQTGEDDPQAILKVFRACGAPGLLGVKLGSQGALLSPTTDEFVEVQPIVPPGDVIDTTGAGDSFYAGLLTGLLRSLPLQEAGRLAAAAGAICVTGFGATAGLQDYPTTAALAGIDG